MEELKPGTRIFIYRIKRDISLFDTKIKTLQKNRDLLTSLYSNDRFIFTQVNNFKGVETAVLSNLLELVCCMVVKKKPISEDLLTDLKIKFGK